MFATLSLDALADVVLRSIARTSAVLSQSSYYSAHESRRREVLIDFISLSAKYRSQSALACLFISSNINDAGRSSKGPPAR
jgi:hypothetical protein